MLKSVRACIYNRLHVLLTRETDSGQILGYYTMVTILSGKQGCSQWNISI